MVIPETRCQPSHHHRSNRSKEKAKAKVRERNVLHQMATLPSLTIELLSVGLTQRAFIGANIGVPLTANSKSPLPVNICSTAQGAHKFCLVSHLNTHGLWSICSYRSTGCNAFSGYPEDKTSFRISLTEFARSAVRRKYRPVTRIQLTNSTFVVLFCLPLYSNLQRKSKVDETGNPQLQVKYPKFKGGEATVRDVKTCQDFGM